MSQSALSAIEHVLETQSLGSLQTRVVVICCLIQMCDGFGVNSIGWSVPLLTHAWHLPPAAFALAFLSSNLGVIAGAVLAAPIGDHVGRKPLLMLGMLMFSIASLASATATSLPLLSETRFFTWTGIAGGFAGTVALTADYTPQRLWAMFINIDVHRCAARGIRQRPGGIPFAGSQPWLAEHIHTRWLIAARAIRNHRAVAPVVAPLPRRPRESGTAPAGIAAAFGDRPGQQHAVDLARTNPIRMLFGGGYALQTTLLWIICFGSLLNLFLFIFWLPEVLHLIGMTPAQSVRAPSSIRSADCWRSVISAGRSTGSGRAARSPSSLPPASSSSPQSQCWRCRTRRCWLWCCFRA